MGNKMDRMIFTDFDGTITKTDSCSSMVQAFAAPGWEENDRLWREKKISTAECARRIFEGFSASPEELKKFIEAIEIDPLFLAFLNAAEAQGDTVTVLSDGYDHNINIIFKKYGIELPFYANCLQYDKGFSVLTPYHNPSCGRCGTCKKTLVNTLNPKGKPTVYIGDGYSDFCGAAACDTVFAKGVLLKHCRKNGVKATPFEGFDEILRALYPVSECS